MKEEYWQAIVTNDATYDGRFYYGVVTTGIFCRPSCKSRAPKRENVTIFPTRDTAVASHFRACKRCRPDQLHGPDEQLANRLLQLLTTRYSEPLTLRSMADELHVSPYHLHHLFKRVTGRTPSDTLREIRLSVAKKLLCESEKNISEIADAVGYATVASFSSVFQKYEKQSPTDYRKQAKHLQKEERVPHYDERNHHLLEHLAGC